MWWMETLGMLVARLLLIGVFAMSAYNKIVHWESTAEYMSSKGLPAVPILLFGGILLELIGSLLLLWNRRPRLGAALLILFLIPTTWIFHGFWMYDGTERSAQLIHFMKNLSILGGLLLVIGGATQKKRFALG